MAVYKIIVTGPFNSGKTEFIKTISEIPVILTEKNITTEDRGIKAETTVAMDFGRITIGDDTVHLFGTPGQTRFSFMWEILAKEMHGFIVLVDATDRPSFPEAAELVKQFSSFVNVPHLIVSNKTDLEGAAMLDQVRSETASHEDEEVMACVATEKDKVLAVLEKMVELVKQ